MGKIRSFLGIFVFLFTVVFAGNSFAAGYVCNDLKQYTSCSVGYYMAESNGEYYSVPEVGNTCAPCPSNATFCPGGTAAPIYKVTLNHNGGTSSINTIYADLNGNWYKDTTASSVGTAITSLPSIPVRPGYVFNGYTSATASNQIPANGTLPKLSYVIQSPTTFTAQWNGVSYSCAAGTYWNATTATCTQCPAGSFCIGTTGTNTGSNQGIFTCWDSAGDETGNNMNFTSDAGAKSEDECYADLEAGTYFRYGEDIFAECEAGYYCPGGRKYFGDVEANEALDESVLGIVACPAGTSEAGADAQEDCYFNVTLDADGGKGTCATTQKCYFNQTCVLPSWNSTSCNLKNGTKTFQGWATSSGAIAGSFTMTFRAPATVYATWATVSCAATNGSATPVEPVDNKPTCAITCNSGFGTSGTYSGVFAGTSYAHTCVAGDYDVSYDCGGGEGSAPENTSAKYGTNFTPAANTCTRAGHIFTGWSVSGTNDTKQAGVAFKWEYPESKTLTAQWSECAACAAGTGATCSLSVTNNTCTYTTKCETGYKNLTNSGTNTPSCTPITYTIAYNGNGGTGTTATSTHTYNASGALTANGFTNGAKQFLGWAETADATTAKYMNAQSVSNLTSTDGATKTLYAVWGTECKCSAMTGVKECTPTAPLGICGTATATALDGYNSATCGASSNGVSTCTATANKYTVVFNPNGGKGTMDPQSFKYDTAQNLTKNAFLYEGLKFQGWATSENGTVEYADSASVKNLTSVNNGTFDLYAVWGDAETYEITYENMDGISNPNQTTFTVTTPTFALKNPERPGYTFGGWYKESTFKTKITQIAKGTTGDQTLYAMWQPNQYTVRYDCNGGTLLAIYNQTQSVTYDADFETRPAGACILTGYTFDGWDGTYPDAGKTYKYVTIGDTTLTAKWKAVQYTCEAGYYLPRAKTECAICPPNKYCAGDTHTYSTTADQGITGTCPSDYPISAEQSNEKEDCYKNVSVNQGIVPTNCHSATWAACTYKDFFGKDDTPCVPTQVTSVTAKAGAYVSGTTCVVCGENRYQTTNGTNATSCSATCSTGYAITGTTLSDHDEKSDCVRTVTLDKNGGAGDTAATVVCHDGVQCDFGSAMSLKQTGYTFTGGWGTNKSCTSTTTTFSAPSADTYFACKTANTYTVSFDTNGGTGGQTASVSAKYDSAMPEISTTAPTLNGYDFMGWFDAKSGGTQYYTATGTSARTWNIANNATLYAQWTVGKMNDVTYNENGGTSVSDTKCNVQSDDITLPTTTREGHTFDGWYNDATGTKTTVIASGTCVSEMSFTAKWTKCGNCIKGTGVTNCAVTVENNTCVATATCANGYKAPTCDGLNCECTPENYTVKYDCGTGTGTAPADETATYNNSFTPAANTCTPPSGYEFSVWNDGANKHKAGTSFTWTYTSGKTLTAEYSVEGARDINYVTGGGEIRGSYTVSCNAQTDDFALPQDVFLEGHEFIGWKDASGQSLGTDYTVAKGTCTAELTFTAEWSKCNSNVNGACGCGADEHPESGVCVSCTTSCSTLGAEYQGTYNVCANNGAGNAETQCYYESTMDCTAPEHNYDPFPNDSTNPLYATDCKGIANVAYCSYDTSAKISCKHYFGADKCEPDTEDTYCPFLTRTSAGETGPAIFCNNDYYRDGMSCILCNSLTDINGKSAWPYSSGAWWGPEGKNASGINDNGCHYKGCAYDCTYLEEEACPEFGDCTVQNSTLSAGTIRRYPNGLDGDNAACQLSSSSSCYMSMTCAPGYTAAYSDQYYKDTGMSNTYKGTYSKYYKYFVCKPNTYTVEYHANYMGSGNTMAPQTFIFGESQNLTQNSFVRDGYTFVGWNTREDGNGQTYNDEELVSDLTTDANGIVVLFAQWNANEYTITYNLNGGVNNVENMPTYTIVNTPITLQAPTKRGFDFAGWFSDASLQTPATEIPANATGNQEFWAAWSPIEYTITYNLNGGTNNPANPEKYIVSETPIPLATPTKTGFTFSKWIDANGVTMTEIATDTIGNIVLNAVWASDSYVITYNLDGGMNNPNNPGTYTISDTPIYLEAPTKTGYIFVGWTGDKVNNGAIVEGTTGDTTVTANWTPTEFIVHFDSTDATGVIVPDVACTYDKKCTAADAIEMLNKTFSAWNTQKDGKGKSVAASGDITNLVSDGGEITLYAIWDQDMVACEPGYYYQNGEKIRCELGQYCPGGGEIAAGSSGCIETCPANGATIIAGATNISQCRKTAIAGDMTFSFGTAKWDCAYTSGTGTNAVYRTDCNSVALTCDAGYFYNGVGNACIPVTDGYYSPAPTLGGSIEDTESKKAHACPGETGASNDGIGSDQPREGITDCYSLCSLTTTGVAHSIAVTPDEQKSFSTTNGQYPACSYTIKCDTGYTPQNGTDPKCIAKEYTITLDKNQGTGDAASYVTCTFDSGECKMPATSGLSRAGYVTANKWCTNANGSGGCYDANAIARTNISATGTDTTLYAAWTPGVFKIDLVATDATVNAVQTPIYLKYTVGWFEDNAGTKKITTIDTSALPSKPGYNFAGYSADGVMIVNAEGELQNTDAALRVTTTDTVANVNWSKGETVCDAGYYYAGNGGECTVCAEDHWCPGGTFSTDTNIVGGHEVCPDGGISAGGVNATNSGVCYKHGLAYISESGKASGTQTCNYDFNAKEYVSACRDQSVKACAAGHYYVSGIDCVKVGQNYFSANGSLGREACPESGLTGTLETAAAADECYKTVGYTATYGSGTQVCNYTTINDDGSAKYATNCRDKYITSCQGGYYRENANAEDCTAVGFDAYSEVGSLNRTPCPDGGDTNVENAADSTSCFKAENPFVSDHGEGFQYCIYSPENRGYTECRDRMFLKCSAGYYWNAVGDTDCTEVGYGFFGPVADAQNEGRPTARQGCATLNGIQGYTDTETSVDASACYMTDMPCAVANGSGVKTCGYNTNAEDYSADCIACQVDTCDETYYLSNNQCDICPAGSICGIDARTGKAGVANAKPQLCSALFNGRYPQSDAGSVDVAQCFGDCDNLANVATMVGRDYQGANITDTCEIKVCNTKYYLEDNKSQCTLCPENSICDTASASDMDLDGTPDDTPHTCDELTGGTHKLANIGSTDIEQCYTTCADYEILGGMAIRDFDTVQYDDVCTYKGISETGNPCEIKMINGAETCVETSCNPDYELVDGRCMKCNRENATAYKPNGNCLVAKCHTGYHPEGDQCADDVKTCNAPNAIDATQTWDSKMGAFGICKITGCKDGYHIEANACVPNTETCNIEHGTGTREWDESRGAWGECFATSCAPGYTNDSYESDEPNKQCGRCRNAKSILGQDAVSSYSNGCTIATCLYQGELYNLENNECVPICPIDMYEDETGTMHWNPKTKKCERECFDGYMSW